LNPEAETETETALEPLLLDPSGPKVVAIGGGHGQAAALEAIQCYASRISALVTVVDDGGSSGRLTDLGIPPPGDLRRCLLALTPEPSLWSELFAHRFSEGDVIDHSLGNLIIAGLAHIFGDFEAAITTAGQMLGTMGEVIPLASDPLTLHAIIDGETVVGQKAIGMSQGHFDDLWIEPSDVLASRRALSAIAQADQIVIGPGSLYTSILSALKVSMLAEAVMQAPAQRVFVLNLVTQDGETMGMNGSDHLVALENHAGIVGPAVLIAHRGELEVPRGHQAMTIDPDVAARTGWRVIHADVADEHADWPAHDPLKLGRILDSLYQGKQ
jgi:uncharacterized cofD-like protein